MTDFASLRVWSDEDATSINPIVLDEVMEECFEATEKAKKKKKRRRRRKKVSEEDSSVADSMLSSILSDSEQSAGKAGKHKMMTVDENVPSPQTKYFDPSKSERNASDKQSRRERLEELKSRRIASANKVQPMRTSLYPSSDEDSNDDLSKNPFSDDDLSKNPFSDQNESNVVEDDDLSKNPFSDRNETTPFDDDDDLSKNPFSDRNDTTMADDDLSKNPFSDNNAVVSPNNSNPFDDSCHDRAVSDSDDEEFESDADVRTVDSGEQIEIKLQETQDEDSDDEDIIESSKRLLRCVDKRLQYQNQNDEVHLLKKQIKQMKVQADAMAEQLRRAVETKCDLVLAQNEMERNHEQALIAKEGELRDLRLYIQDILEQQAQSELNFMNEISSLARKLDSIQRKHAKEIQEKESKIFRLENRIETMRASSVRGIASESYHSRESFHSRSGKNMTVLPYFE